MQSYFLQYHAMNAMSCDHYSRLQLNVVICLDQENMVFIGLLSGGNLAPSFGGRKNFSQTKITIFSEQIYILAAKISDDLFLVINQVFRIVTDFRIFTFLSVVHDPFITRKTPFFYSFHIFAHIRQHYFSKYWGDESIGRPPTSNFVGDSPPSPPQVFAPGPTAPQR